MAYPRSLFVRRTSEARSNRPMKDMLHWVLYEEIRFILSGDQLESELQHDLNSFLGKSSVELSGSPFQKNNLAQLELDDRNLKVHAVDPIFKQNESVYRYMQEGYRDQYCLLIEMQFIVSDAARFNLNRYWWPVSGLVLEPSYGQFCFYLGDRFLPSKKQHDTPGLASFNKIMHRNNARRTYMVWN